MVPPSDKHNKNGSKKSNYWQRTSAPARLIAVAGLLIIFVAGAWFLDKKKEKPSTLVKTTPIVTYGSSGPASGAYEVVATQNNGGTLRVSVVTNKKTDADLIQINDLLLSEYENRAKSLFIDYFDDKEVAKIYFSKMNDSRIAMEQKKELVRHYIAVMVKSPLQDKKLIRIQPNGSSIKAY